MNFSIKSLTQVAIVAVTLAGVALTAIPVQAAPTLGGALQLDLGLVAPQENQTMMMKKSFDDDDEDWEDYCLTNKEIRKGLKHAGFDEIEFVKELKHHRVRVHALYEDDGWIYSMRIDRCDGEVDQIEALYEYDDFDIDFDL